MSISTKFVLEQGPALRGLGETALSALKQRLDGAPRSAKPPPVPGPVFTERFAPRNKDLVRAYVKHVGGDPSAYKRRVPAHLFPQWGFALTGKTLEGLDYPLVAAMNGGCEITQHAPLPIDEPLEVSAQLVDVDDDGRRAILTQRLVTGTPSSPEAVVARMFVFVPLKKGKKGDEKRGEKKKPKETARVPTDAREVAWFKLGPDAGLDFAKLTGDFNPIHWIPAYAKAFGFRNTILHGFGSMARAIEGLNRGVFAGDVDALRTVHVRFTKPLVLPAKVGVYVRDENVFVGPAPGGAAYLTGTFQEKDR